jgi:hypothetical protein
MNDSGLKGNGGERDERGEGSGVTGPETQSGDGRKEKVVLQQEGLSTREGELRTDGLRVTDGVLKSEKSSRRTNGCCCCKGRSTKR